MRNLSLTLLFVLIISVPVLAFQNMTDVEIEAIPLTDNLYMLKGAGGNIGVLTGEDGVFLIDDQFAPLTSKILSKIKTLSNQPVRFLVNTHHHGDHTGGNKNFQDEGALIMAHENVRKRLNSKDPNSGLPIITFDSSLGLHINKNDILIMHVHNAHTDGDALIYFPQSNVLHTGDTFFNGMFPYIDIDSGGSVDGDIAAAEKGLSIINRNTKIIPGHGEVANYGDYKAYLNLLKTIRERILKAIKSGAGEKDIVNDESITSDFYTDRETKDNFITGPKIRKTFYESLKK